MITLQVLLFFSEDIKKKKKKIKQKKKALKIRAFFSYRPDPKSEKKSRKSTNKKILVLDCPKCKVKGSRRQKLVKMSTCCSWIHKDTCISLML